MIKKALAVIAVSTGVLIGVIQSRPSMVQQGGPVTISPPLVSPTIIPISKPTEFAYAEESQFQVVKVWPAEKPNSPVIMFVPGGGWAVPSPIGEDYSPIFEFWAKKGFAIAEMRYRPTFEPDGTVNPFPAAEQDTSDCIQYLRDNHERLGIDPTRVIVSGRSAGAYNSSWASFVPGGAQPDGLILSAVAIASTPAMLQNEVNSLADHMAPSSGYGSVAFNSISLEAQIAASPIQWIRDYPEYVAGLPICIATGGMDFIENWPLDPMLTSNQVGFGHDAINSLWTAIELDSLKASKDLPGVYYRQFGEGVNWNQFNRACYAKFVETGLLQ